MQITYKDKTVLVVGGTSGIGAGIVGAFAGSGASVIATGATEAEVRAARGNALFHVLDVRDNAAVKSYVAGLSRLDVVVNCAGIIKRADATLEIPKVTPEIASPHSALHQGPINIALEAAMTDELERILGATPLQIEHYTVMFVRAGYAGPFVASAVVVNPHGPRIGVEATMIDEAGDGRMMATASAAFRRVAA